MADDLTKMLAQYSEPQFAAGSDWIAGPNRFALPSRHPGYIENVRRPADPFGPDENIARDLGDAAREKNWPLAAGALAAMVMGAAPSGSKRVPPTNAARGRAVDIGLKHLTDYRERAARGAADGFGDYRILRGEDIPGGREAIDRATAAGLDMSDRARLERAYDQGYDLVVPGIHGTRRDPYGAIRMDAGQSNDAGHYGAGFYVVNRDPDRLGPGYGHINSGYGEASYYGKNLMPLFARRGNVLDLGNETGDSTYPGHFKSWASKLEPLGLLGDENKQTLAGLNKLAELLKSAEVRQYGEGDYQASVLRPGTNERIFGTSRREDGGFKTADEARKALENTLFRDMGEKRYWDRDAKEYKDAPEVWPLNDFSRYRTLEQYIMRDLWSPERSGSQMLTDAAKKSGYDSIAYGDEGVLFSPNQARHFDAPFDPSARGSGNLMAGWAGPAIAVPALATLLSQYDDKP